MSVTRVCIKIDKKYAGVFLLRESWFGMFSEWNGVQWTETFEFDCLERMIFDLSKIILGMMSFYHICLRPEHA